MVSEARDQKFIAKTFRMTSAPQEHKQASHFRIGRDDYLVSEDKGSCQRAVKFSAVVVGV